MHYALSSLLVFACAGCSFLFTTAAPERVTAHTTLTCTTSNAAPGIDTVLTVLNGLGTAVEAQQGYPQEYIIAGVAWTLLEAAAAIYGYNVVNGCEAAIAKRDELVEREAQHQRALELQRWQPAAPPPTMQPGPSGLY